MKRFVSLPCLLGVLAALNAASSAIAQQTEQRGAVQERNEGAKLRALLRQSDQKNIDGNASPSPWGQETGPAQAQGREGLSPEERRQLRRDIHEAGRDIYRRDKSERPSRY